ncbi:translocation/assembly module TamB [Compostibacter hankyongensis]|uniref:Translocation/assembly module TamB domain-containing protein n=1 Tax=Compostibacter hankyongensis TaxID=1007089 RepID=A0ABP8FD22_9BACT
MAVGGIVKKGLKIILWITGCVIALLLLLAIAFTLPGVQQWAAQKATSYLSHKLRTRVEVGRLRIRFPSAVEMEDLFVADRQQDTLLYNHRLFVAIDMFKLLSGEVSVSRLEVERLTAHVYRVLPDTTFNFAFIPAAFGDSTAVDTAAAPADTAAGSSLKITLGNILLKDINVTYRDQVSGMDAVVSLDDFRTRFRKLDLDSLYFDIDHINLSGVNARVIQSIPLVPPPPAPEDSSAAALPRIMIERLALQQIKAVYKDTTAGMDARADLGSLSLEAAGFDPGRQEVSLKSFALENTDAGLRLTAGTDSSAADSTAQDTAAAESSAGWKVSVGTLALDHNHLRFDNGPDRRKPLQGMDYEHLDIAGLLLHGRGIAYNADSMAAQIDSLAFTEQQSGFTLQRLQTNVVYSDTGATLSGLLLKTPHSLLRDYLSVRYDSLGTFSHNPGKMGIKGDLPECTIGMQDVLMFTPFLADNVYVKKLKQTSFRLTGKLSGTLDNLHIPVLRVSTGRYTHVYSRADLRGLPDMDKAYFDVSVNDLASTRSELLSLLPDSLLPSSLQLPGRFSLKAAYKGSLTRFNTRAQLQSDFGNARLQADMKGSKGHESYAATLGVTQFELGKLLKQDSLLGPVTLSADLKGSGLDTSNMDVTLRGELEEALVKGYTYRNLQLNGHYGRKQFTVTAGMDDPNIRFDLDGSGDLSGQYPAVKMALNVDSLDLQALHFSDDPLRVRGSIHADLPTADIDHLNGQVLVNKIQIARGSDLLLLDSIRLQSRATDSLTRMVLQSEFITALLYGNFRPSQLGTAVQRQLKQYFNLTDTTQQADSLGQQIRFWASLHHPAILQRMVPELSTFSESTLSGYLDTRRRTIGLNGYFPKTVYGSYELDSLVLNMDGDSTRLAYELGLGRINSSLVKTFDTRLYGGLEDSILSVNLHMKDNARKDQYHLGLQLKAADSMLTVHFLPDSQLLDYRRWQMPGDNLLKYGKAGIQINDFALENNGQALRINSMQPVPNAPIEVSFKDFRIETVTDIAAQDTALVGGAINGSMVLDSVLQNPVFAGKLQVDSLMFRRYPLGNMGIQLLHKNANAYAAGITLSGAGNDLELKGIYYTAPESRMAMRLDLKSLSMKTLQAFSLGQLSQATGNLDGSLTLRGTLDAPELRGNLHFNQAGLHINYLNASYRLPDATIAFDEQGIGFNRFTILDSSGQKAVINGHVYTQNYRDFRFGTNITARGFEALSAGTVTSEHPYAGPVFIDADIRLRGDMNLPKVDMTVHLREKSVLTVALPSSEPGVEEREGVVEFVDAAHQQDTVRLAAGDTLLRRSAYKGLQLSANIAVDTAAQLNILIDQETGDNLMARGDANLNATIDPSGKISLTGRYELVQGSYLLSMNGLIKRKFDIRPGSSITWTGDPLSANVDLTAVYNVRTSAEELVADQIAGTDASTQTTYKQKLPFEVNLNLKGELMKPDITFGIDMPESQQNVFNGSVYARLKQVNQSTSELNKQVLGLLVFNHFIADNPFSSLSGGGGGGVGMMARQSAGKLLSQQLNNLAADLIKGVDVNFDLQSEEDYSTGQAENRTDLNVGLSKQLFNDRTTVYVGSNVELEGPQTPGRKATNLAGDVSVEYKLTKDGRYRVRAYRKDEYQGVVEGQVVETGASFILVMDYNRFRELFHDPARRMRRRQMKKEPSDE